MQPETAFWLLSATAQSSAALAGLSALLLLYVVRILREEEVFAELKDLPRVAALAYATLTYLLAVLVSLVTLALVTPGPAPVDLVTLSFVLVSLGLIVAGSLLLAWFVASFRYWLDREVPFMEKLE